MSSAFNGLLLRNASDNDETPSGRSGSQARHFFPFFFGGGREAGTWSVFWGGKLDRAELDAFVSAGFSKDQALEVVVGLAVSIMANYAGNFMRPQLDAPFQDQRWSRSSN